MGFGTRIPSGVDFVHFHLMQPNKRGEGGEGGDDLGRQFFLSPGQGGDDLGIPADLNWAGRASVTTFVDAYGLVTEIPADCLAAPGYRLEHTLTSGVVTETIAVEAGGEYQVVVAGDASAQVVCSGAFDATIVADGSNRTCGPNGTPNVASTGSLTLTVTGALTELGVYPVTGRSNQNPPEYVSVGVESAPIYHNARVDGYKYFSTTNGNTVNPDGSINEAVGAALPGPLRLRLEPAATPLLTYSEDFVTYDPGTGWGNAGIDTEALSTGAKLIPTAANSAHNLLQSGVSAAKYTTVFADIADAGDGMYFAFRPQGIGGGVAYVIFDPVDGSVTLSEGSGLVAFGSIKLGTSSVYRCYMTMDSTDRTHGIELRIVQSSNTPEATAFVGDGVSGVNVYRTQMYEGQAPQSYIKTVTNLDPRAEDAPLPWPLTTPQAEGMVILEFEYAAAGTGGLIGFKTSGAEGPIYKATDTAQACSDSAGTINAVVAAHASDKSLVFAARWSTDEGDKECLNQSSGAWVSASGTKGVWTTDAAVIIGHSITAPLFINTASVYDEDRGGDFIEGNWS